MGFFTNIKRYDKLLSILFVVAVAIGFTFIYSATKSMGSIKFMVVQALLLESDCV